MTDRRTDRSHVLLVETRIEGHHLTWLRYIAEDLLSAGFQISAVTGPDPGARRAVEDHLGQVHPNLKHYPLSTAELRSGSGLQRLVKIVAAAGAAQFFLNS